MTSGTGEVVFLVLLKLDGGGGVVGAGPHWECYAGDGGEEDSQLSEGGEGLEISSRGDQAAPDPVISAAHCEGNVTSVGGNKDDIFLVCLWWTASVVTNVTVTPVYIQYAVMIISR